MKKDISNVANQITNATGQDANFTLGTPLATGMYKMRVINVFMTSLLSIIIVFLAVLVI